MFYINPGGSTLNVSGKKTIFCVEISGTCRVDYCFVEVVKTLMMCPAVILSLEYCFQSLDWESWWCLGPCCWTRLKQGAETTRSMWCINIWRSAAENVIEKGICAKRNCNSWVQRDGLTALIVTVMPTERLIEIC